MAKITKKKSLSVKGILDISKEDNQVYVVIEGGETWALADLLNGYDDSEVTINVTESVDIA